jgi:hypothetical protein
MVEDDNNRSQLALLVSYSATSFNLPPKMVYWGSFSTSSLVTTLAPAPIFDYLTRLSVKNTGKCKEITRTVMSAKNLLSNLMCTSWDLY